MSVAIQADHVIKRYGDLTIIPGLSEAADALEAAIRRGDHILVFGDFDLDGISATTVLTRGLRALGAQATPFIPLRFEEGYALSQAAITRASCSRRSPGTRRTSRPA